MSLKLNVSTSWLLPVHLPIGGLSYSAPLLSLRGPGGYHFNKSGTTGFHRRRAGRPGVNKRTGFHDAKAGCRVCCCTEVLESFLHIELALIGGEV